MLKKICRLAFAVDADTTNDTEYAADANSILSASGYREMTYLSNFHDNDNTSVSDHIRLPVSHVLYIIFLAELPCREILVERIKKVLQN